MWAIKNTSPYAAASSWSRDKDGVHEWLVAVKATFDVDERGRVSQSDNQPAPLLARSASLSVSPSHSRNWVIAGSSR